MSGKRGTRERSRGRKLVLNTTVAATVFRSRRKGEERCSVRSENVKVEGNGRKEGNLRRKLRKKIGVEYCGRSNGALLHAKR